MWYFPPISFPKKPHPQETNQTSPSLMRIVTDEKKRDQHCYANMSSFSLTPSLNLTRIADADKFQIICTSQKQETTNALVMSPNKTLKTLTT